MNPKIITLGEIMMRLTPESNQRFTQASSFGAVYGGAEANVAVSLAEWGFDVSHLTVLPENDLGKAVIKSLRKSGVKTDLVRMHAGRLGLYFLEVGAMQRASKIIYDRADSAFANLDPDQFDFETIFKGVDWFHWTGITPAISENTYLLTLKAIKAAHQQGVKISADINYRRNLWKYGRSPLETMPDLMQYSTLMVAGETDLENCAGINSKDFQSACANAKEKFPGIQFITSTERNSISATHNQLVGILWNGETLRSKRYDMPGIVDRIGGGDAYIAGLIYGLHYFDPQKALEFATAASVLKHSIPGDANEISVEEALMLVEDKNVGKLLR
ncbi:sugar kinase [Algoriphagus aestuarii]|nr:sugar kinase [Algoriphagus aestuarii]